MGFPGLHWIRRRQRALARGVLALFCLVWLQAALMPCASAVVPQAGSSSAEHHCPYCPPASSHDGTTIDAGASGCLYPKAPQADTRVASPTFMAAPLAVLPLVVAPVESAAEGLPPLLPGEAIPRPPLAVRFCRYLK